jgi:hypothetical protein
MDKREAHASRGAGVLRCGERTAASIFLWLSGANPELTPPPGGEGSGRGGTAEAMPAGGGVATFPESRRPSPSPEPKPAV